MKKINLLFFPVLVISLCVFYSCDKEDPVDPIVGNWEYAISEEGYSMTITFNFSSNNIGSIIIKSVEDGETETETDDFTYIANDSTLTLIMDGESDATFLPYSISGNKLSITFPEVILVFIRK